MGNINIKGRLIDDNGNSLAGIEVTFVDKGANALTATSVLTTAPNGYWTKSIDERGTWQARATIMGKTREWYGGSQLQLNELSVTDDGTTTMNATGGIYTLRRASANSTSTNIVFQKARGTLAVPTVLSSGDVLGTVEFWGYDGSTPSTIQRGAYIGSKATGGPPAGFTPSRLEFYTSSATVADNLRMVIDKDGNVGIGTTNFDAASKGNLYLFSGTAPAAGVADTVACYSSDNAAGHTIPSFFCEGTDVLATGQADSASSVRVKMRINGTVVTLLAI